MTVQDVYRIIDGLAPFDTQAEFDNSGLLVGSAARKVTGILFALDVTEPVIDEAAALGVQLIVTHHPLMFSPRRNLTDGDFEGRLLQRLIRADLSLIAAHTNLDQAPGGINDTLAGLCGLTETCGEGFIRAGTLPGPMTASAYADYLAAQLGDVVRLMGPGDAVIRRPGLCSGGGSDEWEKAAALGCDAFISGEIKHHHALAMAGSGIIPFECGHFATEVPGIRALALALQNHPDTIQCKVRIFVSENPAYSLSQQS